MTEIFTFLPFILVAATFVIAGLFYFFIWRARRSYELTGALDRVLLRVLVAQDEILPAGETKKKEPKDIMMAMEQFYAALEVLRISKWDELRYGRPIMTLEIALPHVGEETIFYVSVPRVYVEFAMGQLHSFFPSAKVEETLDYNIFHPTGVSAGSLAWLRKNSILSLRTYRELGEDPLGVLVGAFGKMKKIGDGAAIQFIISPAKETRYKFGKEAAQKIRSGEHLKEIIGGVGHEFRKFMKSPSPKKEEDKKVPGDEELAKQIEAKASVAAFDVDIRIIVSSATEAETASILQNFEAAFAQFSNTQGNEIVFNRLRGKALEEMLYDFSFRLLSRSSLYLSATELATLYHFPYAGFSQPKVMYLRAREAPPAANLPETGLFLGYNVFRGARHEIFITEDDRRRHMYVVGQTGTGKSTFLKEMAAEDIKAGRGVCFIDPHGQDVESLLEMVPENRLEDVIYFNPADTERPMGLNFLEYDTRFPEQKTFVVNELFSIFQKLYGAIPESMGPMFEQYFRNATMLVLEDPASGNTLLEVSRVMADKTFRDLKLSRCANIVVETFWHKIAEKAGGEASLQNMVPYITSKFDTFLANEIMRPIIAQEKSSFNFREAMDEQKILLINLSKGRLGELNSYLLGLVIVGKILMASLSRTDMPEHERKDFYLYIDEFQNVTTRSIATILSEARKYRLDLTIAHQFLGQLEEEIKKAVFGNVGTMVVFRIGTEDAEFLEKQFSPVFSAKDLLGIENRKAYIKLLIHGEPARAFNIHIPPPDHGNPERKQKLIELSRLKYGRPREEIETSIRERYKHV